MPLSRKLAWFVALWIAGAAALGIVALLARLALRG
ncbi:MAG: DUF2474 family protein [Hyphomicrobiales bacterium]|nr:DUF2474 family protein [Hyphomicrobiales bacterium]